MHRIRGPPGTGRQGYIHSGGFDSRLSHLDDRLVVVPRGAFVTGVFTGELREFDGTLVGVDSRRCTVPADLRRSDDGLQAVIRPLHLDLMGIDVDVGAFAVSPVLPFPASPRRTDPRRRHIVGGLRSIHPR